MLKANRKYLLLLLIFTFSFIYRMLLMLWDTYPSGADIGLHNSVIYSITGSGNVNLFYNFYHMGGGTSLTFPGYHIFASSIMLMTGLPEYVVHAAIVSLFSALIVLAAFLITRRVWSEPAAYIVAFLAAISRFDIEMLLWGGYPNVITLLLIPVIFYLYLQKDRFSLTPFLVSTSILAGSIFLTHSLSAAVYVAITFVTVLFVLVRPKVFGTTRKTGLYWLLPIVLGAILFSPFIIQAVPAYLQNNASLAADTTSSDAIKLATVGTRVLSLELVLPLFGVFAGFLVFSKKYVGRFLALPTFLLSMWVFVPLLLTQSYLVGFSIDYNRFLYFLILPLIIFIAVLIEHGSSFFAHIIVTYRSLTSQAQKIKKVTNKKLAWLLAALTHKNIYAGFIVFFLLFSFITLPIFMGPMYHAGESIQKFYQTMDNQGWEAIQWAKTNTPKDSVFVSDALYGWWFGGFAQRRTYSAVDPQYLSINEEYNKTLFARSLLDTDYLIDNNLTQVREDGGYLARHNPEILATLNWTYFPFSFFNFDSHDVRITYHVNGDPNATRVSLDELAVKEMRLENFDDHKTIVVVQGNDFINYTRYTTIYKGLRFVELTSSLDSIVSGVSFDFVDIKVQTGGVQIPYNDKVTVGLIEEGVKAFGQLIFTTPAYAKPEVATLDSSNVVDYVQLYYSLQGQSQGQITIMAGAYSVTDSQQWYKDEATKNAYFQKEMTKNLDPNQPPVQTGFEQVFNYQTEMQIYDVSFVACRVPEMYAKFRNDPSFSLVFINGEVAIFKVKGSFNQDG
jgi:hypothetical protein